MLYTYVIALLFSVTSTEYAAGAEPIPRKNKCLPEKIQLFAVHPREDGFDIQLPVLHMSSRCKGEAEYVIQWTPEGQTANESRIPWSKQHFRVSGLKPWTKVQIKGHMEYKRSPEWDYDGYIDEYTPVVKRETITSKGTPSPPMDFREDEIAEDYIRVTWNSPETPNGPIDGYSYTVCSTDVHCDREQFSSCNPNRDTSDRHSQKLRFPTPLRYYSIRLRAFNQGDDEKQRLYSNPAVVCIRFPPKSVKRLENVNVECENNPNRISVSWSLPKDSASEVSDVYVVEINGRKAQRPDIILTEMANKSSECDSTTCTVTVHDLKADFVYSVSVRPHIDDIGPFGEDYVVQKCILPPSAPPPAKKHLINIEDPARIKTEAEFGFWKDTFDDTNGDIKHYDILVSEDKEIEKCSQPTQWKLAHSKSPVPCYIATSAPWMPFKEDSSENASMPCKTNGTFALCVLGSDILCGQGRCNGPLKGGISYAIRVRAYTDGGHTDSAPLYLTAQDLNGGKRINADVRMGFIVSILPLAFVKALLEDQRHRLRH